MWTESQFYLSQVEEYTRWGFYDKWTFCDYIKRWGRTFPDKESIIDARQRLTWGQYSKMMDRIALNFLELGIKKNDLVVTQLSNCIEAVIVEFALARIGACVVPLAMQWRAHELNYVISQTNASAVIIPREYQGFNYVDMMKDLQLKHQSIKHIIVLGDDVPENTVSFRTLWDNALEEQYPLDYLDKSHAINANDLLTLCYTSGTEAEPKGCPRTHNMWKSMVRFGFLLNLTQNMNDKVVMALPWINLFGQSVGILSMAMVGGTLILRDGFDPTVMAQTISKEKATLYPGVPAMHVALLNCAGLDEYDLSSLRVVATGGAPCPTDVLTRLMDGFNCLVWNGWGSNEGTLNTTEIGMEPELISTTIGVPQLFMQTKIVDEQGNRLEKGQIGEICQKGPNIIYGYYRRPDLNKKSWDDEGFFHTGDAGYIDEEGFLRFVTRIKDVIIRGGMNISAEEVEFILYKHPKVLNVSVVGMPDEALGQRTCAYIELKAGVDTLTLEEVRDFMQQEKVAKYKWPERVEIIQQLPRTPTGKVLKYKLREEIAEKLAKDK